MTEYNGEWMGEWTPDKELPQAFLDLPAQIYAGDEFWLGEDATALQQQFSKANAWFETGRAWLGVIPGQARLAGFIREQEVDGERAAFFGFWESVNDSAPTQRLLSALTEWARAHGATRLYGPINFTTFGAYRLRLDNFEAGAFPGEPWNPDYYPGLLEQLGFTLRYQYFSTFNAIDDIVKTVGPDYLRVKPKLEQAITFEAVTPEFWMAHLSELYGFVDQVFGGNFAYTALSFDAFVAACGAPFAKRLCPHTSVLARTKDGRIAGFFLTFPDYSPLLRQNVPVSAGKRLHASALRYDQHYAELPQPRLLLAKTGGVHADFRSLGLFTAMGCELSLRAQGRYEMAGAALVRADNPSREFALRHGTASQRGYGLFQRAL